MFAQSINMICGNVIIFVDSSNWEILTKKLSILIRSNLVRHRFLTSGIFMLQYLCARDILGKTIGAPM